MEFSILKIIHLALIIMAVSARRNHQSNIGLSNSGGSGNNYLKNSEKKSKGIFCLPLYPEMTDAEVLKVCKILKNIMKKLKL